MKSALTVLKEQVDHFYLIRRLSLYELKNKNKNNYLGIAWEVIHPVVQILIYWLVFGTILTRDPITIAGEEITFISWLMSGFFLWIFFYQATIQGSKSIYSRLRMLSKMNFPMSIIPSYIIFSQLYVHIFNLAITIAVLQLTGYYFNVYYLQIIYFMFGALCLVFTLSLVTSTLSTIIRDVHMFLNSTLRMLIYLSGVLWPVSLLHEKLPLLANFLKLNPLYYLMEGYRASFFGEEWYFITHWEYTLYFWIIILLLLLFGSMLHIKFRRYFIDYL